MTAPAPAVSAADVPVVTVWSDIGCPWASLALHTLRAAIRRHSSPLLIGHRAFPLELFNAIPTPKGILDVEVAAIAPVVPGLGWRHWNAPEASYPVTTIPAMAAVQAAKAPDVGGLPASDQLDAALRHALYADHRCISVPAVILDIAAACLAVDVDALRRRLRHGDGITAVYDDYDTACGPGIQGSPHIILSTAHGPSWTAHNPGATYRWSAPPPQGFPRLEAYDPAWADDLVQHVTEVPSPGHGHDDSTGRSAAANHPA